MTDFSGAYSKIDPLLFPYPSTYFLCTDLRVKVDGQQRAPVAHVVQSRLGLDVGPEFVGGEEAGGGPGRGSHVLTNAHLRYTHRMGRG